MDRELAIGDFVILPDPWGHKVLCLAKVLGFTLEKVKLGHGKDFKCNMVSYAYRMCRGPSEEVMEYLLRQ